MAAPNGKSKAKKRDYFKICAAYGCNNYQKTKSGLSFYHFPSTEERCAVWVKNLRRKDLDGLNAAKLKYRLVCAKHFEDSQFCNPIRR